MELTNKAKVDFEKWYLDTYYSTLKNKGTKKLQLLVFKSSKPSMKYGVYVDFFDGINIEISINPEYYYFDYLVSWSDSDFKAGRTLTKNRTRVRELAIIDANEIYNNLP